MKTGICTNKNYLNPKTDELEECPKCKSGEKIKVEVKRISDFRCPVCGEKLTPVKESVPVWIWGAAAAAVVAIIVLVVLFSGGGSDSGKGDSTSKGGEPIDTVTNPNDGKDATDTVKVVGQNEEGRGVSGKTNETDKKGTQETPPSGPKSVLGGAAKMTTSGGYTTIKFIRSYNLDLGNSDNGTLTINPGDEIYMANVRNGYLFAGQLKRSNGEETAINGVKVRL